MTTHTGATAHLRDADLMRLLDGEETAAERVRNAAHLSACARCAGAVERLRGDAGVVRGWLHRAEFEASLPKLTGDASSTSSRAEPGRDSGAVTLAGSLEHATTRTGPVPGRAARRRAAAVWRAPTPWLRAAAVLALIAAPVAAIPSLRERIVDAISDLRGGEVPPAMATLDAGAALIWFEPAPGEFLVRIDASQPAGTLRIEQAPDGQAALRITDGLGGAGPVISSSALHIRNEPGAVASYVLQLPAGVTGVSVRIGERSIARLDASALRVGAELPVR